MAERPREARPLTARQRPVGLRAEHDLPGRGTRRAIPPSRPWIGARWDEPTQNGLLRAASESGLIDHVEANYPVMPGGPPEVGPSTRVLVHCPINPIASAHGFNRRLARQVRAAAIEHDSPWIGEHLCWAGPGAEGRLGYIVNPLFSDAVREIAVENARALAEFYGRPLALELAPAYDSTGSFESEVHFLASVARGADALIIFDLAHWTASNRNLRRPADYGLDALEPERVIELHVAGIRSGRSGRFWHDSHGDVPPEEILELAIHLARTLPRLRAVTFEHAEGAPESDFVRTLEHLRQALA